MTSTKLCRHCCRKNASRPRGLCWCCYYQPGVLALYPSTSKYQPRTYGEKSELIAPVPKGDPDYRKQRCVACSTKLCVDEPEAYCQDCVAVKRVLSLIHPTGSQRSLWGPKQWAEHEVRIQAHAARVLRECRQAEAVA